MSDNIELIENDLEENDLFDELKLINAINENNLSVIRSFLEKNLYIDYVDNEENTLIHLAVIKRNKKILHALLDHCINPNQLNSDHLTPLHIAVANKDIKIAKLLLKYGADPHIFDSRDRSPYALAEEIGFVEYIAFAEKAYEMAKKDLGIIDNEAFLKELAEKTSDCENLKIEHCLEYIGELCDKHLFIPQKELKAELKKIKSEIKTLTAKLFENLGNDKNSSEIENLKFLRKFLSILNSVLIVKLNNANQQQVIQKLSKLENFLEEKIIKEKHSYTSASSNSSNNTKAKKTIEETKIQAKNQLLTLEEILIDKRRNADKYSPYNYLDFESQKVMCRQVYNDEMCFIDKLTIKTHYPINNQEIEAILYNLEKDASKKQIEQARKFVKNSKNILLLSQSKKFDEIIRAGKKNNAHLIYFCKNKDSYENNLDKLARLSFATGCTVHSFNYPGINNSNGQVNEKRDMIYAGLATINQLLNDGINLNKIFLISDSESYSIIKNVAKQFLLRDMKVNRMGVIDTTIEHNNHRKFKPTSIRKLLLYYHPNSTELALHKATTKEEKVMESFNNKVFFSTSPKFFEGTTKSPSYIKLLKEYIEAAQQFLQDSDNYFHSRRGKENIEIIIGEIQN